jgi:hypothetical protein
MRKKMFIFTLLLTLTFIITTPTVFGASKTPTVAELQKKITALTKQVKDLTTKLTAKTKEADKLKKEKTTLENLIKNKDKIIQVKQDEIDNLKYEIVDKDKIIEEQNKKIQHLARLSTAKTIYTDENINILSSNSKDAIKWYEFETKHSLIYMSESAYEQNSYIINISDKIFDDITTYFGKPISKKVKVYIWQNETINRGNSTYIPNESAVFINASIFSPIVKSEWNVISTFVHEVAHAFTDLSISMKSSVNLINGGYNYWINEGLAVYIAYQHIEYKNYDIPQDHFKEYKRNPIEYTKLIQDSFRYNKLVESSFYKLPGEPIYSHYGIYESLVFYINEKYGKDKFLEFIEKQRFQNTTIAFESVFGVSEEQFIKDWKKYFLLN